jgi:hypothetical protein
MHSSVTRNWWMEKKEKRFVPIHSEMWAGIILSGALLCPLLCLSETPFHFLLLSFYCYFAHAGTHLCQEHELYELLFFIPVTLISLILLFSLIINTTWAQQQQQLLWCKKTFSPSSSFFLRYLFCSRFEFYFFFKESTFSWFLSPFHNSISS